MPCFHPLQAFQHVNGGALKVQKSPPSDRRAYNSLKIPCRRCIGCRLTYSQMWGTRIMHEAQMHSGSQMLTLTYDDQHLPSFPHSLIVQHTQIFMRALRFQLKPKKIRFYSSGEYGEPTPENLFIARPHWHIIIFGHEFTDLQPYKQTSAGIIYESKILNKIWGNGFATIVPLSTDIANYVAKYCLKKIGGEAADAHYTRISAITGEIGKVRPEFATMSLKPGIAHSWYKRYQGDIFPSDQTIIKGGQQVKTPTYYDTQLSKSDPDLLLQIKEHRAYFAHTHRKESTERRLLTRELVAKSKTTKRNLI